MYIHWKALLAFGFAFWGLLCCSDLLGESTWKRCAHGIDDLIKPKYEFKQESEDSDGSQKTTWTQILWNICAFLCTLIFCSVLRSMSWVVCKVYRFYNVFRNRRLFVDKVAAAQETDNGLNPEESEIFTKEVEELKREKEQLSRQLSMVQKENLSAKQKLEEYRLETFMVREKLQRTTNTLKENLRCKELASANKDVVTRKAQNLEIHLKEVSRDRDNLRSQLVSLEKKCSQMEQYVKNLENKTIQLENLPEKDTDTKLAEIPEPDVCQFQFEKINSSEEVNKTFKSESNSSVDLEESSVEKDDELQVTREIPLISAIKQNILNYTAYKVADMLRPRFSTIKESENLSGSSSDDNSAPQRIISSTAEFQNFLKTLKCNSNSTINFAESNVF